MIDPPLFHVLRPSLRFLRELCLALTVTTFLLPHRSLHAAPQVAPQAPLAESSATPEPVTGISVLEIQALSAADQKLLTGALTGDVEMVKTALSEGARLESRDVRLDLTPLMLSIYRDHATVLKELVAQGASLNARNPRGQTPLMMLASGGQLELVSFLLASGAQIDARDELGNTALLWATYWGHREVIERLLAGQAEAAAVNDDGNNALHLIALGGIANQTRKLLKKPVYLMSGRLQASAADIDTSLFLLRQLVAAGAAVNRANRTGQTPLLLLAEKGAWSAVDYLISVGADRNHRDQQGEGFREYAQRSGDAKGAERFF
jgi:uncharacterized protein